MKQFFYIFLFLFTTPIIAMNPQKKPIVFVLFTDFLVCQDPCKALKQIGYSTALSAGISQLWNWQLPTTNSMTKDFFTFLKTISIEDQELANISLQWNNHVAPLLIKQWLAGKKTSQACLKLAEDQLTKNTKNNLPNYAFLKKVIPITFDPQKISTILTWNQKAQTLLQQLKKVGTQIGILDNFNEKSYNIMKQKFPEKYTIIDGPVIFSSTEKQLVGPKLYKKVLKEYTNSQLLFITRKEHTAHLKKAITDNPHNNAFCIPYTENLAQLKTTLQKYLKNSN